MSETSVESLVEELLERSDSELDERVRGLELERRRVEAELALAAGEIDRRRSYLDDGHRSLKAYLRATCNYSCLLYNLTPVSYTHLRAHET